MGGAGTKKADMYLTFNLGEEVFALDAVQVCEVTDQVS